MESYCPQCVEKLIPNTKNLGGYKNWLVCPKCEYRTYPATEERTGINQSNQLSDRIKKSNETGGCRGDGETY